MKKIFRILLYGLFILVGAVLVQFAYNEYRANRLDQPYDGNTLSSEDLTTLKELRSFKDQYGGLIWPGFDRENIPVVLFNDRYEFMANVGSNPDGWKRVGESDSSAVNYYRRQAKDPQAFAVQTQVGWAGRFTTLNRLNRRLLLNLRRDIPVPLNKLMPSQMILKDNDYHMVALVHEMFHAHQANQAPEKFAASNSLAPLTDQYPYHRDSLNHLFSQEGKYLVAALETDSIAEKKRLCRKFLQTRHQRREQLPSQMVKFEKHYEWLEGLAKYAEVQAYKVALDHRESLSLDYQEGMPHWQTDRKNLRGLGRVDGSTRFYLSGMAQARLLDQIAGKWKKQAMTQDVYLEGLIRQVLK